MSLREAEGPTNSDARHLSLESSLGKNGRCSWWSENQYSSLSSSNSSVLSNFVFGRLKQPLSTAILLFVASNWVFLCRYIQCRHFAWHIMCPTYISSLRGPERTAPLCNLMCDLH